MGVPATFMGAWTDAIRPPFPEAKLARVGCFFVVEVVLACWRCWCLACLAAAASLACPPPRVNLIAGTFGEGTAGGLLRRACAMWYSFDSPAGTKILRGGDGDGDGVKFCFFSIWVMTAGVGTGTTGLEVVTSIFIS